MTRQRSLEGAEKLLPMDSIGGDGGVIDEEKEFTYSHHQKLTHRGFKGLSSQEAIFVCGSLRSSAVNFLFLLDSDYWLLAT